MLHFVKLPSRLALTFYTSRVPAGFPSPADDHVEGRLDLNLHLIRRPASTFFVRAEGESMKEIGIFGGDILVVDRSIAPQNNDIVIAILYGELTVKRLKLLTSKPTLSAENTAFPDIPIDNLDCEIWGVVIHSIRHHCSR